jgi:hypothetical protein
MLLLGKKNPVFKSSMMECNDNELNIRQQLPKANYQRN